MVRVGDGDKVCVPIGLFRYLNTTSWAYVCDFESRQTLFDRPVFVTTAHAPSHYCYRRVFQEQVTIEHTSEPISTHR